MKRLSSVAVALSLIFLLSSCQKNSESDTYTTFGMEFISQIEWWEECLAVDLDDIPNDYIKTIFLGTGDDGNDLTIQYIDLEGAGEDFYSLSIQNSDKWTALPYAKELDELIGRVGADKHFAFSSIEYGNFIVSGIRADGTGIDFDMINFEFWRACQIGIWDRYDECLYYISVERQP